MISLETKSVIETIFTGIGIGFNFLFGGIDTPLIILVVFIVLDWISGIAKAIINKTLSVQKGLQGFIKKILLLCLVIVGVMLDRLTGNDLGLFRMLVCYYYIANEGLSILENLTKMNIPIPAKLKEKLESLFEKEG